MYSFVEADMNCDLLSRVEDLGCCGKLVILERPFLSTLPETIADFPTLGLSLADFNTKLLSQHH